VLYADKAPIEEVVDGIKRILVARHGGEDFTVTTQQQMLDVLGSIIGVLTLGVAALGGISLLTGGVWHLHIMTIAVRERTEEVGLLRAIGARRSAVAQLFVGEAMLLSAIGGVGGTRARRRDRRRHPLGAAVDAGADRAALCRACDRIAVAIGLIAGVLPARAAARLEPWTRCAPSEERIPNLATSPRRRWPFARNDVSSPPV
jgi:putative ABC transport system permease protein